MTEFHQHGNICFNCSGEYEYRGGRWICPYCGSLKPEEISNEETTLMYTAFKTLRLSEFEAAESEFDDFIRKYPHNSHGYWGRLLAKYCIKYEEDYDGQKIPTCYAKELESISLSSDYQKALQYADRETKEYFQSQVTYIENIRKEWIEKASKEKPYDIFICYKDSDLEKNIKRTEDSIVAQDLYTHFTEKGYRVFYSHVSLREKAGEKYEPYIFHALSTAKVMLVYGQNPEYINSTWLKNEWTRYRKLIQLGEKDPRSLIVAYEGFSPTDLPGALKFMQCVDASEKSFYETLDKRINQIIQDKKRIDTPSFEEHSNFDSYNKNHYSNHAESPGVSVPQTQPHSNHSLFSLDNIAGFIVDSQEHVSNQKNKDSFSTKFIRFLLTLTLSWLGSYIINHSSLKPQGYVSRTKAYFFFSYLTLGIYSLVASINNLTFDPNKPKNIGYRKQKT